MLTNINKCDILYLEVIKMVVIAKNQKSGLKKTCMDCKYIIINGGTGIEDYHTCGLWLHLHKERKDLINPSPINGIPKWCPFDK